LSPVPAQPADFQAEAESDTRILLTWLPASQERITKYELLYWEGEDGVQVRALSLLLQHLGPNITIQPLVLV